MNIPPVPHLATAMPEPLHRVEQHLLDRQAEIESWFRTQWRYTTAPFYSSVDLRNSGYKLAPVDTNLFPAGFNNLNIAFESLCIQALQTAIGRIPQTVDRVLIIPENHTRNQAYLENLAVLKQLIEKAGFEVRIGSMIADMEEAMDIKLASGHSLCLEPVYRENNQIRVQGFTPELVLLNNDLSSGRPEIIESLEQQIVMPVMDLGWSDRLKSVHFRHYKEVTNEFSQHIDLDPWLIAPLFRSCGAIDFMQREGNACLSNNVAVLLEAVQKKYDEYNIQCRPFLMVKADRGTYGMGVMTVHSTDDVAELNRKQRTRMSTIKEGQKVSHVLIQEGVYTHETWGEEEIVAEPVVYMIDNIVVGGFYRVHGSRAVNENLNTPGMRFEPLAFDNCCISPEKDLAIDAHQNRFYTYGVIARLASLAAAREMVSL